MTITVFILFIYFCNYLALIFSHNAWLHKHYNYSTVAKDFEKGDFVCHCHSYTSLMIITFPMVKHGEVNLMWVYCQQKKIDCNGEAPSLLYAKPVSDLLIEVQY